jgi:hypothetical protein
LLRAFDGFTKDLKSRSAIAKLSCRICDGHAHLDLLQPSCSSRGEIEDDDHCITLRTPYDERAKRFVDLSRCRTSYW